MKVNNKLNITLGDMAEALAELRKEIGLFVLFSEREILNKAIEMKEQKNV